MKQTDFEELEGTEVVNQDDDACLVAGCNFDVGITCVDIEYTDYEMFCINGPSSPHYEKICKSYADYEEKYSELFYRAIDLLKKGEVISDKEIFDIVTRPAGGRIGSSLLCAYKG